MELKVTNVIVKGNRPSEIYIVASWKEIKEVAEDLGVDFKSIVEAINGKNQSEN